MLESKINISKRKLIKVKFGKFVENLWMHFFINPLQMSGRAALLTNPMENIKRNV